MFMKKFSSFVFVSSYDDFAQLAHSPKGKPAQNSLRVFGFDEEQGTMTLLYVTHVEQNPAFLRYSRMHNVLYACTESIEKEDKVHAFSVCELTGKIELISTHPAGGRSCCYLTIDPQNANLLCVNYWDSFISSFPLDKDGRIGAQRFTLSTSESPNPIRISRKDHQANRHTENHPHAIALDPYCGKVAYVPDLGKDQIKQFNWDSTEGRLKYTTSINSGNKYSDQKLGPRYLEFHPSLPLCYCVNEISSTVGVLLMKTNIILTNDFNDVNALPTLELIQELSTLPMEFPKKFNTCGRIALDPTGQFLIVSNRGHNSLAVFKISTAGTLESLVGHFHTRGETPRHFQFDPSGKFLFVANQDTDNVSIFTFDSSTGVFKYTGHSYDVPSPNFVCAVNPFYRSLTRIPTQQTNNNNSAANDDKPTRGAKL